MAGRSGDAADQRPARPVERCGSDPIGGAGARRRRPEGRPASLPAGRRCRGASAVAGRSERWRRGCWRRRLASDRAAGGRWSGQRSRGPAAAEPDRPPARRRSPLRRPAPEPFHQWQADRGRGGELGGSRAAQQRWRGSVCGCIGGVHSRAPVGASGLGCHDVHGRARRTESGRLAADRNRRQRQARQQRRTQEAASLGVAQAVCGARRRGRCRRTTVDSCERAVEPAERGGAARCCWPVERSALVAPRRTRVRCDGATFTGRFGGTEGTFCEQLDQRDCCRWRGQCQSCRHLARRPARSAA